MQPQRITPLFIQSCAFATLADAANTAATRAARHVAVVMDAVMQAIVTTCVVPKKSAEIRLTAWRQDPNSSFSLNLAARPQPIVSMCHGHRQRCPKDHLHDVTQGRETAMSEFYPYRRPDLDSGKTAWQVSTDGQTRDFDCL